MTMACLLIRVFKHISIPKCPLGNFLIRLPQFRNFPFNAENFKISLKTILFSHTKSKNMTFQNCRIYFFTFLCLHSYFIMAKIPGFYYG